MPLKAIARSRNNPDVNRIKISRRLFPVALTLLMALACSSFAATEPFRFAFLSDTHIGSANADEDLRAAVRDLNAMTNLSFAILSGDVTEYGSREQLLLAKEILGGLKIPCHVVPGNHDTKWSESGATDFPRFYGDERFNFEFGGYRFLAIHQGPLMKMGDGFWSPQDVRWLTDTLKHLPDQNQPLVFITHYPVDDGIANWFEVLDLLKRYNTQIVLCGHGHRNKAFDFEGVPGVMGRSNLRAKDPVGGFNLVEVRDGKMMFSEHPPGGETKPPWRTVALVKHDYASDTNKYRRPDFSMNAKYPKVKERWQFDSGWTIAATPTVWQDLAIVGDASGTAFALALKSGEMKWKFKALNAVYSTPEVSGDRVVFYGTKNDLLLAVDGRTGALKWQHKLGTGVMNTVVPLSANEILTTDFSGKVTMVVSPD